jgi:23S rRNA maturation mini-RNase III
MDESRRRELAWIGDAVLALMARNWILEQQDIPVEDRKDVFVALTSNSFLGSIGDPTGVEAHIGTIYRASGFEAASDYFNAVILPLFKAQEANRRKRSPGSKNGSRKR